MTSCSEGNASEVPEFLNIALVTTEDGSCTFISDTISDQSASIVNWEQIEMSEGVGISKPDPFLNQISIRDSPILLHLNDNDVDQLGDVSAVLDNEESGYYEGNKSSSSNGEVKADKNMNMLSKENISKSNVRLTKYSDKCETLERIISTGLTVEIAKCNSKLLVKLQNLEGCDAFSTHFVLAKEAGHTQEALVKQPVKSVERIQISKDLNVRMPCLHTELGLRLWLCPLSDCRRAFYRLNIAKLHALKHLDHKPFKCDHPNCKWAFYTAFKMKRHQETHSKRKDFVCTYPNCERRFTTIYNLNWHKRHNHEKPATIPCLVQGCDKLFQTVHAREVHLKVHGQVEAPYQCPVVDCRKQFFLFTALSTHARVHSYKLSDLRCQWPNCGRVFEQPCRLKQHTLQHTGQRPFICTYDECKWAFSTASKLKRHLSTHTNERKFHCTMGSCNKSFLRSEHLKEHTLTHIGQRPFNCEECDAMFSGKSALYLHLKRCHPKEEQPTHAQLDTSTSHNLEKLSSEDLLEQAIQSLDVPSDIMMGTGLLPEEPLELLENENFSTVNLRDLE